MLKDKDVKKRWRENWQKIDNTLINKDVYYLIDEMKCEYLMPILPAKGKTLEVGAGSARLSCFLATKGCETTCVDYCPEAFRVAKNNYRLADVQGNFVIGDAYNLPFANDFFDVVFSTGLLEHFEDPLPLVAEMVRVLKRGGLFYSDIVPCKFSLLKAFNLLHKVKMKIQGKKEIFEGKYSKMDIIKLLNRANLQSIRVFAAGVFPPFIPLLQRFKTTQIIHSKLVYTFKSILPRLDDTILAEWLGFYYFCYGYKK